MHLIFQLRALFDERGVAEFGKWFLSDTKSDDENLVAMKITFDEKTKKTKQLICAAKWKDCESVNPIKCLCEHEDGGSVQIICDKCSKTAIRNKKYKSLHFSMLNIQYLALFNFSFIFEYGIF